MEKSTRVIYLSVVWWIGARRRTGVVLMPDVAEDAMYERAEAGERSKGRAEPERGAAALGGTQRQAFPGPLLRPPSKLPALIGHPLS